MIFEEGFWYLLCSTSREEGSELAYQQLDERWFRVGPSQMFFSGRREVFQWLPFLHNNSLSLSVLRGMPRTPPEYRQSYRQYRICLLTMQRLLFVDLLPVSCHRWRERPHITTTHMADLHFALLPIVEIEMVGDSRDARISTRIRIISR